MSDIDGVIAKLLDERRRVSRRDLLRAGAAGLGLAGVSALTACASPQAPAPPTAAPAAPTAGTAAAPTTAPAAAPTAAPKPAAGTYKGTIKISYLDDFSGPVSGSVKEYDNGSWDYFRYVNETMGGVAGYKLDVTTVDSKFDAALTRSGYKRLQGAMNPAEGVPSFLFSAIASAMPFVREMANTDKVVVVCPSGSPTDVFLTKEDIAAGKQNYYFALSPTFVDRVRLGTIWAVEDWKKKGKSGKPKTAAWCVDDEPGHTIAKAAKIVADQFGAQFVGATFIRPTATDAVSQVTTLKGWGADYIVFGSGNENNDLLLARDSARMDFRPQFVGHITMTTAAARTKEPALVGAVTYSWSVGWKDTQIPEVALMHKLGQQYRPDVTSHIDQYLAGWAHGMVVVEAFRRVIEKHGGADKLTGENILAALESLQNFDTHGLMGNVTYTPRDHRGAASLRFNRINEQFDTVPVSPFMEQPPYRDEELDPKFWAP